MLHKLVGYVRQHKESIIYLPPSTTSSHPSNSKLFSADNLRGTFYIIYLLCQLTFSAAQTPALFKTTKLTVSSLHG